MTEFTVNKNKFIIIPRKEYETLQKKAALKVRPQKLLSLSEARSYSKVLIGKWAQEKSA